MRVCASRTKLLASPYFGLGSLRLAAVQNKNKLTQLDEDKKKKEKRKGVEKDTGEEQEEIVTEEITKCPKLPTIFPRWKTQRKRRAEKLWQKKKKLQRPRLPVQEKNPR